ncbi:MAG: alpha/beta fold hydrolase [Ideonella sp.]|nr:alpha/beta fold hydrolase [Ideonella sp.]MCC7456409.1 alpha/beta fold hydrolase [Nitrospira sp.]
MEAITFTADDGAVTLSGCHHAPAGQPKAAVLIAAAMGVTQDYYAAFAQWLAQQGYAALTFDYRGSGASLPPARSLRGFRADLFDWARDTDAAIDALLARHPGAPLVLVGHSLGAQLPGLLRHRDRIAGLVSVAAGSGYWRDNAPRLKRVVLWFWHVLVPLGVAIAGYFPGKRLGKVGDLPRGVVLQWRRWCLNPRYHVGAEGEAVRVRFAGARFPIVALSITDDEMMTERGTRVLIDCYESAPRELQRIAPADVGVPRIGHFGLFRRQFETTLWPRVERLLAGFAPLHRTA